MVGVTLMREESPKVDEVLTRLVARDAEELSVFRMLFHAAHSVHRKNVCDLGLSQRIQDVVSFDTPSDFSGEVLQFLKQIPAKSMRYFHGLVEALDIYHSIHGRPVPVTIDPSDDAVREIRQIRDLCIQDGLHSIY